MHLEIVTPEKTIFSDTVDDVYLPGAEGEMGVLNLHAALITSLQPGELRYRKGGQVHELAIGAGFAEVGSTKVSVLTDMAIGADKIDEAAAEEAIKRAEEALTKIDHSVDAEEVAFLQAAIAKSLAQLKIKRKGRSL